MRKVVAVAALVAALVLPSGCAGKSVSVPQPRTVPTPRIGIDVPVVDPKTPDVVRVRTLVDGNINDTWETTKVASFAEAKRLFPQAMLPKETLGRRLVGIVYRHTEAASTNPKQVLHLVYENGLEVSLARYDRRRRTLELATPSEETTFVNGMTAKVGAGGGSPHSGYRGPAIMRWEIHGVGSTASGSLYWTVLGWKLTKADVVQVGRSLAP